MLGAQRTKRGHLLAAPALSGPGGPFLKGPLPPLDKSRSYRLAVPYTCEAENQDLVSPPTPSPPRSSQPGEGAGPQYPSFGSTGDAPNPNRSEGKFAGWGVSMPELTPEG